MTTPWLSIWTKPRATISKIVAENPNCGLWWLASIYGVCALLNLFQSMALGREFGVGIILILAVVLAPFYGYVSFAIWSWFVFWTGKWFKGKGTFKTVRASYAWSCVPIVVNIPLWGLMAILFGHQLFANTAEASMPPMGLMYAVFAILVVKVIMAIWSLVIFLNTLAEVQGYSMTRSIFNVIVAALILFVLFAIAWSAFIYAIGGAMASGSFLFKPF